MVHGAGPGRGPEADKVKLGKRQSLLRRRASRGEPMFAERQGFGAGLRGKGVAPGEPRRRRVSTSAQGLGKGRGH